MIIMNLLLFDSRSRSRSKADNNTYDWQKNLFWFGSNPEKVIQRVAEQEERRQLTDNAHDDAHVEPPLPEVGSPICQANQNAIAFNCVPFDLEKVDWEVIFAQKFRINGRSERTFEQECVDEIAQRPKNEQNE